MIKVHVHVRENLSAWLEARIVKALHERHPEVPHKPYWNKPETDKWSGNPNKEEAQDSTAEAIKKGQKTAESNRKKRVREVHGVVINKLGKLVRALRAMNCWWLGDHIWIGNLREKITLPINLKEYNVKAIGLDDCVSSHSSLAFLSELEMHKIFLCIENRRCHCISYPHF